MRIIKTLFTIATILLFMGCLSAPPKLPSAPTDLSSIIELTKYEIMLSDHNMAIFNWLVDANKKATSKGVKFPEYEEPIGDTLPVDLKDIEVVKNNIQILESYSEKYYALALTIYNKSDFFGNIRPIN